MIVVFFVCLLFFLKKTNWGELLTFIKQGFLYINYHTPFYNWLKMHKLLNTDGCTTIGWLQLVNIMLVLLLQ